MINYKWAYLVKEFPSGWLGPPGSRWAWIFCIRPCMWGIMNQWLRKPEPKGLFSQTYSCLTIPGAPFHSRAKSHTLAERLIAKVNPAKYQKSVLCHVNESMHLRWAFFISLFLSKAIKVGGDEKAAAFVNVLIPLICIFSKQESVDVKRSRFMNHLCIDHRRQSRQSSFVILIISLIFPTFRRCLRRKVEN